MDGLQVETGIPMASEAAAEISAADKGPPASAREQGSLSLKRDDDQISPSVSKRNAITLAKKMGGPITRQGKEKSRRNAVKHGILAKVVLLQNEPSAQFDALLQGFRTDLQPKGTLEGMLVEKLAALTWRYRRMLVAERTEIRLEQQYNSRAADRRRLLHEKTLALETSPQIPSHGLLGELGNPESRKTALELLRSLQTLILLRGFEPDNDFRIIGRVFGVINIFEINEIYSIYKDQAGPRITFEPKPPDPSKEVARAKFVDHLQKIIDRHSCMLGMSEDHSETRERMESVCAGVPEPPRLDRLLRYSASLERDFDRTLNQLERLQRMRMGESVPPTLNVKISS